MNKKELVAQVAARGGLEERLAEKAVNALMESIAEALLQGHSVGLMGFGAFSVRYRAARTGRNPITGKRVEIAAKSVPTFKPAKALADKVSVVAENVASRSTR